MRSALFFVVLFVTSLTEAQSITTEVPTGRTHQEKRIHQGNLSVGGGLNLGYSSNFGFMTEGAPSFEYFVFDRFSMGFSIPFRYDRYFSAIGIGPSASFYFWEGEKWAAYFNQKLFVQNYRYDSYDKNFLDGSTSLGMLYYFNPNVAVGSELSYRYSLEGSDRFTENVNLGVSLKFYF